MRTRTVVATMVLVVVIVGSAAHTAVAGAHRTPRPGPAVQPASPRARRLPPVVAGRYERHVFGAVTVTRDIVYTHVTDHAGAHIALRLDVYSPAHDADARRAAILFLHPGGFTSGNKEGERRYAVDAAQRGYVAASIDYRLRPTMDWFNLQQRPQAARDAFGDATTAIHWLRAHAAQFGIDTRFVFAAGYSAGAVTALELASPPDGTSPAIAGAAGISGYAIAAPRAAQAPRLVFHGTLDPIVPYELDTRSCEQAHRAGDRCELVTFVNGGHDIGFVRVPAIAEQTAAFFAGIISGSPA